jgi:hypothetical protein
MTNPFDWKGAPSSIADLSFRPSKDGRTRSQVASDTVAARTAATGRSPGYIPGIDRQSWLQNIAGRPRDEGKGRRK